MENNNKKEIVIELKNITKKFGDFTANDNINLLVRKGEIHAILGENGAGKSTLMNQLFGIIKPTSGQILIDGKQVSFKDSNDAMANGIGMVHQHFMLVDNFTVCENIILGSEPENGIKIDMEKAHEKVLSIAKKYNFNIDLDAKIKDISVSMQQKVEILKILYRESRILIFDEPTASLTPFEIDEFLEILKKLACEGKSIIIITHKLREIKTVADKCTIIRAGKYITTVDVSKTSEDELAELMVGRKVTFKVEKTENKKGDIVLDIKNIHLKDYRKVEVLKGLDLSIRSGEIVGIAGIDGNGQSELVEAITGLHNVDEGEIKINGINIENKSPKFCFDNGVSCIPQDRQKYGLVLDMSVADNMIIQNYKSGEFSKNYIINKSKVKDFAEKNVKKYDIRPDNCATHPVGSLSGGNQQKVIIAREVENDKDLLIAFNPTRGVDVGAKEYIHKYIVGQRNKGKAVLLVSFELDEVMSLSDEILVMFNGKINHKVKASEATEKQLGVMMVGGKA